MKKLLIGGLLAVVVAVVSVETVKAFWRPTGNRVYQGMKADPLCQQYVGLVGSQASGFYKKEPEKSIGRYTGYCYKTLLKCNVSWDATTGNPVAGAKEFFQASLATANWGGYWQFKFQSVDPWVGFRAMYGSVLYNVPNAVDLIADTLSSREKFINIYGGPRTKSYAREEARLPYLALFYLGAKNKADVMIDRLNVPGLHQSHFLNFAHFWTLSPAQKTKIEGICLKAIGEARGDGAVKRSCMRYLSRIGSKNSDLIEHMMTFASKDGSDEGMDAIRALGILKAKKAKKHLQGLFKKANFMRSMSVKKGRKYKQVKVSSWPGNDNVASVVMALVAMGDGGAMKAVQHWTSMAGDSLLNNRGFENLVFEATLSSPAAQKKVSKAILGTLKKLKRYTSNSSMERAYRYGHVALLQMGNKAGLKHVMEVLGGSDSSAIKETLQQLGGMCTPMSTRLRGIQRIRVGKGGISVGDARKLMALIQKRMKFWSDRYIKTYATQVVMELMGLIKSASL